MKKLLLFFKQNKHKFIQLPISKMKNSWITYEKLNFFMVGTMPFTKGFHNIIHLRVMCIKITKYKHYQYYPRNVSQIILFNFIRILEMTPRIGPWSLIRSDILGSILQLIPVYVCLMRKKYSRPAAGSLSIGIEQHLRFRLRK